MLPGEFVGHTVGNFLGVGRIDFSPDGTRLAVGNQDGVPKVWTFRLRSMQALLLERPSCRCSAL